MIAGMYTSPCSVPPLVGSPNGPTKTEPDGPIRHNIATAGTGQGGAGWACGIAQVGVLINHLTPTCVKFGDSSS